MAQKELSPLPYEAKGYIYSPAFLAPPSEERAARARQRHPEMEKHLDALADMNRNICLDSEKVTKKHEPHAFQGQFFNSIKDFDDFCDVTDFALLHLAKDELYEHSSKTTKPEEVVIAGGGPTGMLAAIEAVLHGHNATVIEAQSTAIRMRLIGIYPEDVLKLARFGAPIELFYDMLAWCEKDAAILYDIENYITAIALKLGVKVYRNARAEPSASLMQKGLVQASFKPLSDVVAVPTTGTVDSDSIVFCHQESRQNIQDRTIELFFDTFIDCTGSKRTFVNLLTGREDVIDYMHILAGEQLEDNSDRSFYQDKHEEHISKVMADLDFSAFVAAMEEGRTDPSVCAQNREVTAFTSNMPRNVFKTDEPVPNAFDKCPPDWVCIPMPFAQSIEDKIKTIDEKQTWGALKVQKLIKQATDTANRRSSLRKSKELKRSRSPTSVRSASFIWGKGTASPNEISMAEHFGLLGGDADIDRVQFEGQLPLFLKNAAGETLSAKDFLNEVNKERSGDLLWAFLACCVGESSLDREAFDEYVKKESSWTNPTQNTTAAFSFSPMGIRTNPSKESPLTLHGFIPGSNDTKKYFILGDATGDPWFRWGIGVHDACYSVRIFSHCLNAYAQTGGEKQINGNVERYVRDLELRVRKRHVQSSGYYWHFGRELDDHPQMIEATTIIQERIRLA